MNLVIMGCGRVGARMAGALDEQGHRVAVIDLDARAFRRLPPGYEGGRVLGNAVNSRVLERAGLKEADAFIAVTQGDNRNYMASQIAKELYRVPKVLCRIYDPIRQEMFDEPGLQTFSPTSVGAQMMLEMLDAASGVA
jgi:trk system potassium uptake protein TrkA